MRALERIKRVALVAVMLVVTAISGLMIPFPAPLRAILHRARSGTPPATRVTDRLTSSRPVSLGRSLPRSDGTR